MPTLLDNQYVKASGYVARGYSDAVLDGDFKSLYDNVTMALALVKAHEVIPRFLADVKAKAAVLEKVKDQSPPAP